MGSNEFEFRKNQSESKSEINETLKEQGNRLVNSGKTATAEELSRLGNAIHTAADRLHEQNDNFAHWADSAAERVDSAKDYFNEREPGEIMDDVQGFSKRNPYLTVVSMFIAGTALSRFLKSGSGR
jgi:hypothetical protein